MSSKKDLIIGEIGGQEPYTRAAYTHCSVITVVLPFLNNASLLPPPEIVFCTDFTPYVLENGVPTYVVTGYSNNWVRTRWFYATDDVALIE